MSVEIVVDPSVTASVHDAGIVLFHTERGQLFSANIVGARIWSGLRRALPLDVIAAELSEFYAIPQATAREHTARFVHELADHHLIARGPRQ